jgi:hypothetical protein
VAVACPDPRVREALRAHPLGGHLIVTTSLFSAVSEVLVSPSLAVARLRLTSHPTAPRASRDFVARALLDWRLGRATPFASVVVGELVTNVLVHTGTNIDVSVAWNLAALRLAVRDHGPALRFQSMSAFDLQEPGLVVVARLTRAFGVLPAADGGKLLWAVLEAPRPRAPSRRTRSDQTRSDQKLFTD